MLLEQPSLKSNKLSPPLGISYSAILLPLRPASLMHENLQTCKQIHEMCPIGCKIDWSIWRWFYRISCPCDFCSCFCGCYVSMHTCFSLFWALNRRKIFSSSKLQYRVLESVLRLTVWLHRDPSILMLGLIAFLTGTRWFSWCFIRWVPGLTITLLFVTKSLHIGIQFYPWSIFSPLLEEGRVMYNNEVKT